MRPSLILLDMMMPEMDGWLLRQELKKSPELASIPIVILSGHGDVRDAALALGAVDYLRKPLSIESLLEIAERYCRPVFLNSEPVPLGWRNRRWAVSSREGAGASRGCWRPRGRCARRDSDATSACRRGRPHACRNGPLPTARWLTLETPHFELHFYPEEREFAEHAARVAERAYRLITRYLNWRPQRTRQRRADRSDRRTPTARASSVPYNFIYAYGAPPDGMDELSDFDDFVKLLITHEFTHVVHLDTILSWCPRLINTLFGKIYAPNLSQPTWFIEGLAVLMESRHTTAGRLRSSFYDMHLRVPFLEGRGAGPRRGVGRVRPARLSGRQRPLPVRLQHPPLRRGSLRAREGPRDLAPLRRRVHRRRHQPRRAAGGRAPLRRARSATDIWDDWGALRRRTATRCRTRRPSGAA